MGSTIEINDTLKLKRGAGFPPHVTVGETYPFSISERRLYHLKPIRVFLVEDIGGKWNFVGHAVVVEQTIDAERNETRGRFVVTQLYPPEYAALVNRYEAPPGKGYIPGEDGKPS